tara:strand:+ start:128 stop:280 length:153 start_codon:yes stop_codon:yes gene_type:complete
LRLGQAGVTQWEVVTKLPALPKSIKNVKMEVAQTSFISSTFWTKRIDPTV